MERIGPEQICKGCKNQLRFAPKLLAISGIIGAKLKKEALPEPIRNVQIKVITNITVKTAKQPPPEVLAISIKAAIPPDFVKLAAKTSAQTMSATVEVKTLPMPSKNPFVLAKLSLG